MSGHEGQMSFERQVAAVLGSMSEDVPAGRYAPPRTMLRRANVRITGTLAAAALAIGLICLGGVLLTRTAHGSAHLGGRVRESTDVTIGAQAAAYAADSISGAAAGWADGTLSSHSKALGVGGVGGFTQAGGYRSGGSVGGPSGDDWLKGSGGSRGPWIGPPGGDRGSGGGSGGGPGGGSGDPGGGSGGAGGGGGPGGEEPRGGHHGGGIGPDIPGAEEPPSAWQVGLPPQSMDGWTEHGADTTDGGPAASTGAPHASGHVASESAAAADPQAGSGQTAPAARAETLSSS
jgi:hypothetical protein